MESSISDLLSACTSFSDSEVFEDSYSSGVYSDSDEEFWSSSKFGTSIPRRNHLGHECEGSLKVDQFNDQTEELLRLSPRRHSLATPYSLNHADTPQQSWEDGHTLWERELSSPEESFHTSVDSLLGTSQLSIRSNSSCEEDEGSVRMISNCIFDKSGHSQQSKEEKTYSRRESRPISVHLTNLYELGKRGENKKIRYPSSLTSDGSGWNRVVRRSSSASAALQTTPKSYQTPALVNILAEEKVISGSQAAPKMPSRSRSPVRETANSDPKGVR